MIWRAHKNIYSNSVDLLLLEDRGNSMAFAQPVNFVMVTQDRDLFIAEPTLRLKADLGQSLMQALWDAGLRPNDGAGSGAEAVALRKHIAFAERIADGLLSITKRG